MLHKVLEEQKDQFFCFLELLWVLVWVEFIICVAHAIESWFNPLMP